MAAGALLLAASLLGAAQHSKPKVVVLGFDGADPGLIRRYMAEGRMPNFERLAREGTFKDLTVTNPPQTPVSWGAFITGLNPGRNHVFDFLVRDVKTYKPRFALMEEGSRRFLLGRWNRWAAAGAVLTVVLLLWAALTLARRRRPTLRAMAIPALAGLVLAAAAFLLAGRLLPHRTPWPLNHLEGKPFWESAAEAGNRCLVFRVPDTFPANPYPEGRLLAGLGVPDMRGRVGTPYLFTNDPTLTVGDNEFSVEVVQVSPEPGSPFASHIQGPFNKPFYEYVVEDEAGCATEPTVRQELKKRAEERLEKEGVKPTVDVPLTLTWDPGAGTCAFEVQGQKATLRKGQWSEWVVLDFAFNRLVHLEGMARFYVLEASPSLRLYMSPIHFHPHDHGVPISYPRDYAEALLKRFGFYKTMGWAVDTWTISSGLADEDQFLSDVYQTVDAYQKMMDGLLKDGDWDLYVQVYEYTDRVAHILWQYMDPKHPLYRADVAPKYQEAMARAYERMDAIVGDAVARLPKDATLIVLSDHGFTSFRRAVNYNRWLIDNGYMALKSDTGVMTLEDLFDDDRLLFKNVDWSRTKVYALGLGNLYVNLKGRERDGIVHPGAEYDALLKEIQERLPRIIDPETGDRPVFAVYTRDQLYKGYDPDLTPDMRVTNVPGYRVSWQTSLGGAPEQLVESNLKAWSGDHCSLDPSFVPGMFLCNRKVDAAPDMLDMAPTILGALDLKPPAAMEGRPLLAGTPR